jgi:hypothetical protein
MHRRVDARRRVGTNGAAFHCVSCPPEVLEARAELFWGLYDSSSGTSTPPSVVVRCPRCRRTVGSPASPGWRRATCDHCGASLSLRPLDRNVLRVRGVRFLNPDCTDDDAAARRFANLEIE